MNHIQAAALILSPFAAWYIQYLIRWAAGPFGIIDKARQAIFGVAILEGVDGEHYHQPLRSRFSGVALLECSRCTLFWVGFLVLALVWYFPLAVIALGISGAASIIDDVSG